MPKIELPDTIKIPFESLSNEQRLGVKLLMEGRALQNPLAQRIKESKEKCEKEISIMEAESATSLGITDNERNDVLYLLGTLNILLDNFTSHSDNLSGSSSSGIITDFYERISVARTYTNIMKSITGSDQERYSFIFNSIMGAGELCLDRVVKTLTCDETQVETICGDITAGSGISGLTQEIKNRPSIISSVLNCFLPSIIECIEELITKDELNYCEAKKVIEGYSAGTRIVEDINSNPFYSEMVQQIFASDSLKESIRILAKQQEASDEATRKTSEFFKDFPKIVFPQSVESNCSDGECCEPELEMKSVYNCTQPDVPTKVFDGFIGPPGMGGANGPMGFIGPIGPDGNCECDPPDPMGACCVNDASCLLSTELQCLQWNGNYRGDNSTCEFAFCGVCEEDVHCDCGPCTENSERCVNGNCIDSNGNTVCQICCNGECTCPCDDGICPPCPTCPSGTYQCQGECCPQGYCCVDCVEGECNSDFGGGGSAECPGSAPYCCGNNCSFVPCFTECGGGIDCPDGQCCCYGVCTENCPCTEPPISCTDGNDCPEGQCCCAGWCGGCPCTEPPEECIEAGDCQQVDGVDQCCCNGGCTSCPCIIIDPCNDPDNPIYCPPGYRCVCCNEDGDPYCEPVIDWPPCGPEVDPINGGCEIGWSCVDGRCIPNACACTECRYTSGNWDETQPDGGEPDYEICVWDDCGCECLDQGLPCGPAGGECEECIGGHCTRQDLTECQGNPCCTSNGDNPHAIFECVNDCAVLLCNGSSTCEAMVDQCEDADCAGWLEDNGFGEWASRNMPPGGNPASGIYNYKTGYNTNQPGDPGDGYAIRSLPPGGDYQCGCVSQCQGGGCPDCLIGGVQLGCCPQGTVCCGGTNCCHQTQCCGGNECCSAGETCCGSECCGDYGPNAGVCCNGQCCEFNSSTPCCGPYGCSARCPDGHCPNPNISCNGGCGCDAGETCCNGTCCDEVGPCCAGNGGCPCGQGENTGQNLVCCDNGCCEEGEICCQGECQNPNTQECCEEECGGDCVCEGHGIEKCCGHGYWEDSPYCCKTCTGHPLCCDGDCCPLYGTEGTVCPCSWWSPGENPWCGGSMLCDGTNVTGTYCGTCWVDKDAWISPHDLVVSDNCCDCECQEGHFEWTISGTGGPSDGKKNCCRGDDVRQACGDLCCPEGQECHQAPGQNNIDWWGELGVTSHGCCRLDECECWEHVGGVYWELHCCDSAWPQNEVCCKDDALSGVCTSTTAPGWWACNPGAADCQETGCKAPCFSSDGELACCEWYHRGADGEYNCCDGECWNTQYPLQPDYLPDATCCQEYPDGHPAGSSFTRCDYGCCPHYPVAADTPRPCKGEGDDYSACPCPCSRLCGDGTMGDATHADDLSNCNYYCSDATTCCDGTNCDDCPETCPDIGGQEYEWRVTKGCGGVECQKVLGSCSNANQGDCFDDCPSGGGGRCGTWSGDDSCPKRTPLCPGYGILAGELCELEWWCEDCYEECGAAEGLTDGCHTDGDPVGYPGAAPGNACKRTKAYCPHTMSCVGIHSLCETAAGSVREWAYAKYYEPGSVPDGCNCTDGELWGCCCKMMQFWNGNEWETHWDHQHDCCGSGCCQVGPVEMNEAGEVTSYCKYQDVCLMKDCNCNTWSCCEFEESWCGTIYENSPCSCDSGGCSGQCKDNAGNLGPCPGNEEYWHGGCCPCADHVHDAAGDNEADSDDPSSCVHCTYECEAVGMRSLPTPPEGSGFDQLNIGKDIHFNDLFEIGNIKKQHDNEGRFTNYKVSQRRKNIKEVLGTGTPKNIPLAKPLKPVHTDVLTKFQIVNFLADDGLKTNTRKGVPLIQSELLAFTRTKSNISTNELKTSSEIGLPGFEGGGAKAKTITGSMVSTVSSDGSIKMSPMISFVSGSNIRLDVNEGSSAIQISVDDLDLYELNDVNERVNDAATGDILIMESDGKWNKSSSSIPTGPVGPTFDYSGDGLSQGILYIRTSSIEATGDFLFDGSVLGITSSVNFNSGFTSGGTVEGSGNVFDKPKFKDTAEGITTTFAFDGSTPIVTAIIDWDNGPVQYVTGTGGGNTSAAAINPIVNNPATGDAQTVTLVITNGGLFAGSPLVYNGKWAGGTAPVLNESGIDIISIMTIDNGVTNYCFLNGEKMT